MTDPKTTIPENSRNIVGVATIEAPLERVFKAHTDEALLAKSWCRGDPMRIHRFERGDGGSGHNAEQSGEGGTEYERFGSFQEVAACARILQKSEYLGMPKRGHVFLERADLVGVDANTTEIHTVSTSHSQKKRDGMVAGGMEGRSRQSVEALGGLLEARDR